MTRNVRERCNGRVTVLKRRGLREWEKLEDKRTESTWEYLIKTPERNL